MSACQTSCGPDFKEEHWLDHCSRDEDCAGSMLCECGVCTLSCEDDAFCERGVAGSAMCRSPLSVGCEDARSGAVCLKSCTTVEQCSGALGGLFGGSGLECTDGVCASVEEPYEPFEPTEEGGIDAEVEDAASDAEIEDAARDASGDASSDEDASPHDDDAG